jgi:predicted lipase
MKFQDFKNAEQDNFNTLLFFTNTAYFKNSQFLHRNEKTDTQFVFKKIDNNYLISFAGTESFKDIITDTNIDKMCITYNNTNSNIRVHEGFYKAYLSVRESIHDLIMPNLQDCDRFFISGHSLGGALALLCALDIRYNYGNERDIFTITLGQPKVGNLAFTESANKRLTNYFRMVNGKDVVPMFPVLGYKHCGELITIGDSDWYKLFSVENHLMANYLRILLDFT